MKVRIGFVSNSSSSSFLMYGARIRESTVDSVDAKDMSGLIVEYGNPDLRDYDEDVYVGRSWGSVGDDETGLAFKQSIEKAIESVFGTGKTCRTMEDAWYNG